jgi:hypothetical protein
MDRKEAINYVKAVIKTGNKERIAKVLLRYREKYHEDILKTAEKIFGV